MAHRRGANEPVEVAQLSPRELLGPLDQRLLPDDLLVAMLCLSGRLRERGHRVLGALASGRHDGVPVADDQVADRVLELLLGDLERVQPSPLAIDFLADLLRGVVAGIGRPGRVLRQATRELESVGFLGGGQLDAEKLS